MAYPNLALTGVFLPFEWAKEAGMGQLIPAHT